MRRTQRAGSAPVLLAILIALALLTVPALAGNTLTVTGDVVIAVPPIAEFSADPTSGTAPLTVHFTDESTGPVTEWAWDFQNDGTVDSTEQDPAWTYTATGTYTVKLTVTGPGGSDSAVKTDFITVSAPVRRPIALFTQDIYAGTAPLTVQFTDRSLFNPTQYFWRFGDGATSAEKNPQHTFTRRGIYPVRLDVSNAAGSSTAWSVVVVLRYSWW